MLVYPGLRSELAVVFSASEQKPSPKTRLATWDEDEDAVLPMIPDLEEVQEEDLALQVAAAPRSAPTPDRAARRRTPARANRHWFLHSSVISQPVASVATFQW